MLLLKRNTIISIILALIFAINGSAAFAAGNPLSENYSGSLISKLFERFSSVVSQVEKTDPEIKTFDNPKSIKLPVILYHHVDNEGYGDAVLSEKLFKKHMQKLKDKGYNTVSLSEIENFVYYGADLPENPILITFDDGYLSNYTLAYPILKQNEMKATIFVIGWAVGMKNYKNTGFYTLPHFDYNQAQEMIDSGLIEIQSHTYDMHQTASLERTDDARESVLQLEGESEAHYINALKKDFYKIQTDFNLSLNTKIKSLAYPHGLYSELSEKVFEQLGIKMTFTTDFTGKNILTQGNSDCLRKMYRFTISESLNADDLIKLIESVYLN